MEHIEDDIEQRIAQQLSNDTSLENPPTEEELAAAADDELARRIRREVRRMQDMDVESEATEAAEDAAQRSEEEQRRTEREKEAEKEKKRRNSILWSLLSGSILLRDEVRKYYSQMVLVAVLFFVSIFVMFWSLHLDMRYSELSREVQLLRERSVRLQELKYSKGSHSAVVKELNRRGLDLDDATRPSTIIEEGLW